MADELALMDAPAAGAEAAIETSTTDSTTGLESTEAIETTTTEQPIEQVEQVEAPQTDELAEFKGSVAAQLRELAKQAPGLDALLQKFPQVRDRLAATFRREAAYRELGTVAEVRAFRENFPRGQADVDEVFKELEEINQLDTSFESRDAQGQFPGHAQLISQWFGQNRQAAVALFRTMPREWARLDPDSYNDVLGKIVGATLQGSGIIRDLSKTRAGLAKAGQTEAAETLGEIEQWLSSFSAQRAEPSVEERRLAAERAELDRQKADTGKETAQRFHQQFIGESARLQKEIVEKSPLLARLPATIPPAKKAEIVGKIVASIREHLGKNAAFMRALKPAYNSMNLQQVLDIQKHSWSQPWLLNMHIRKVMEAETPGMVRKAPVKAVAKAAPTGKVAVAAGKARKVGGQWMRPDGSPFTTQEVLMGKHLE